MLFSTSCTHAQSTTLHRGGEITLAVGLIGILAVVAAAEVLPDHKTGILEGGVVCVPISLFGAFAYIATDAEVNAPHEVALTAEERSFNAAYEIAREAKHAARRGAGNPTARARDERARLSQVFTRADHTCVPRAHRRRAGTGTAAGAIR